VADWRSCPASFDVAEVFKGRVASDRLPRSFVSTECGEDLFLFADLRDRVVIAIGYKGANGYGMDPVWAIRDGGRVRSASVEGGGRTYAELAAALRGDLPPTAPQGSTCI